MSFFLLIDFRCIRANDSFSYGRRGIARRNRRLFSYQRSFQASESSVDRAPNAQFSMSRLLRDAKAGQAALRVRERSYEGRRFVQFVMQALGMVYPGKGAHFSFAFENSPNYMNSFQVEGTNKDIVSFHQAKVPANQSLLPNDFRMRSGTKCGPNLTCTKDKCEGPPSDKNPGKISFKRRGN